MRVYQRAAAVFQSRARAEMWLRASLPGLDGLTPLEVARTEQGARLIEHVLTRIAFGEPVF